MSHDWVMPIHDTVLKRRNPSVLRGFPSMDGTGLEPVTRSLSSWFSNDDARQQTVSNGCSHAAFGRTCYRWPARLRERVSRRLCQDWAASCCCPANALAATAPASADQLSLQPVLQ